MKVSEIMTSPVITVRETATLEEAARTMCDHKFGCVPVVDDQGKLVGIVTESDFAAKEKAVPFSTFRMPQLFGQWLGNTEVEQMYRAACANPVADLMTRDVITVSEEATIEELLDLMLRHDVNRILVVRDQVPIGIVARYDLLKLLLDRQNESRERSSAQSATR